MIAVYTDIRDFEKYLIPVATRQGEEREYNMCKALRDLQAEAERRGEKIGEKRGEKIGERKGEKRGAEKLNKLIQYLIRDGRQEDLLRSTKEPEFQQELFREYCIE
ncbi:MAG: hypothetical protein ACI4TB_04960 [Lachnospiraceae bacterium]